jgi:hypothetical protein
MKNFKSVITAAIVLLTANFTSAQEPHLHVSNKWKECSFQLDPSLTQDAWHQFAREAGMVTYFRSVTDAKPMGKGHFELSLLQWNTKIDESVDAWNNTFVHPNSEHWLIGGEELPFPGLSIRAGITKKIDVAAYWSERPGANYGVAGAQFQYNLINDTVKDWALSTRASINCLYGPADLNLYVVGVDVLASKNFNLNSHFGVSTYGGISAYGSHAHEKTDAVDLKDEYVSGLQGMAGIVARIYFAKIGVEYNFANVNTLSYKLGFNFNF